MSLMYSRERLFSKRKQGQNNQRLAGGMMEHLPCENEFNASPKCWVGEVLATFTRVVWEVQ